MQNRRWNISILVIFILLAASLLGLLTLHYVKQLLQYQGIVSQYTQSYYIAKWWTEVALAASRIRQVGIDYNFSGGVLGDILTNIECEWCDIAISMRSQNPYVTPNFWTQNDCGTGYFIPWSYIQIFPMFRDAHIWSSLSELLDPQEYTTSLIGQRNSMQLQRTDNTTPLNEVIVWLFVLDEDQVYNDWIFFKKYINIYDEDLLTLFFNDYQDFINQATQADVSIAQVRDTSMKHYIIVANASLQPVELCLQWQATIYTQPLQLPTDTVYITSQWQIANSIVGLEATLQKTLPQYLVQSYVSF